MVYLIQVSLNENTLDSCKKLLFLPEQIFPAYFTEKRYRKGRFLGSWLLGKNSLDLFGRKDVYIIFNRNPSY